MQQVKLKHIKICLLGSKKVGKTFLAHKLVNLDYDQYLSTKECQKFTKQFSQKKQTLIYYDLPPIRKELVQQLTTNHVFDVIVCLFKDSTSFGQLYEFFQLISKKTEESNHQFKDYWQNIRNFILVYSDFDQIQQVQLQQLFKVLIGQIRNFNRSASIKQFVLKPRLQNYQYLRQLIQKNRYLEHTSKENIASATEITNNIQHNQQKVSVKITEIVSVSPHEKQIQIVNQQKRSDDDDMFIPILTQVKLASGKEKLFDSQNNINQEDNFHTLGKSQQGLQHTKNNINSQQGQVFRNFTIDQLQTSYQTINDQGKINRTEQQAYEYKQLQTKNKNIQEQNKKREFQINKSQQMSIKNDIFKQKIERQQDRQQEKQKEHYREVFNKLVQKINNEQVHQSKKTSYQNLFEQFRQTSKDESKITKQLKEYWQQKIYKLQEEDEDDEVEAAQANQKEDQNEQLRYVAPPSQQEKPHPRSAGNKHKKHGQPLKPQSSFDGVTYKRQKKAPESKSCFCLIM